MEDDSDIDKDLDNSLLDPHHGLDSSTEEGESPFDTTMRDPPGEHKEYVAAASGINGEHVTMLEEMVFEMKQGFQAALEELAKIQDKEEGPNTKLQQHQQQQQQRLDDLTHTVHDIKDQISSLVKVVEQVHGENIKLKEDCLVLKAQVQKKGLGSEEHNIMESGDTSSEWTDGATHNPFENGPNQDDHTDIDLGEQDCHKSEDNDEVTAIACAGLSLTQALGGNGMVLNMSASSEDGDEPANRRTTSITPKTSTQNADSNRRHSMPGSMILNSRNKQMEVAAQRQSAVKELADSERDYCSQLWALLDTYLTPLQTTSLLSIEQLDLLFPPFLERLYAEHCSICSGLQDKLVHWSYMASIANLLARITETYKANSMMALYQDYSEFLPDAIACLRESLSHSAELRSFLKTIQQSSCHAEDLMTLIIAPIQHLPKYLLQLQQICKYTPPAHPDYLLLQTSLKRLRSFVEKVNERVNHAMTTTLQDSRNGSSNDSSQVLSARDSGIHSNEEEIPTARNFFRSEQNLSPEGWHEEAYYSPRNQLRPRSSTFYHDQWQRGEEQRKLSSQLSALSQPDLTRYDNLGGLSIHSPSMAYGHIPRSHSGLPSAAPGHQAWGSSQEETGGHRKYKLRPHRGTPEAFQPTDNPHMLPATRSRPASAIDFTSVNPQHFQQHLHDFIVGQQRPRSAMGPLDPHHRPTIISRKHGRRTQPPLSSSGYWMDNSSSHQKHQQNKMAVPPLDLLPSRPSPLPTHNSLEDEEEDDTRASDSHSFATSGGSHQHSSSHCSRDDRELDLDLRQVLSESDQDHGKDRRIGNEFSEDDVAASLAWKLCADSNEKLTSDSAQEDHNGRIVSSSLNGNQSDANVAALSSNEGKSSTRNSSSDGSSQRNAIKGPIKKIHSRYLESRRNMPSQSAIKIDSNKSSSVNGDSSAVHSSEEFSTLSDSAAASSYVESTKEDDGSSMSNVTSSDSVGFKKADDEAVRGNAAASDSKSNSLTNGSLEQSHPINTESVDEGKNSMEQNRQFLLSLTQYPRRSPSYSDSNNAKKKSVFSSTAHISLKSSKSGSQENKIETTFSPSGQSSDETDIPNSSSHDQSSVSSKDNVVFRRSAPVVTGSQLTNGFHGLDAKAIVKTSSPNTQHKDFLKSGSYSDSAAMKKGDNSDSDSKPRGGNTNNFLETMIDDRTNNIHSDGLDSGHSLTEHELRMTRSLDMSELFITDDGKERRRDRKKMKENSGTYQPTDSLPKANDDPVGARKKMHLKSSLKNLFSKKRGRVMMADVERAVILEMASEALTTSTSPKSGTASPSGISSPSVPGSNSDNLICENVADQSLQYKTEVNNVSDSVHLGDVFEMRWKKDQANSTDSPVKLHKLKIPSPATNGKSEKESKEHNNSSANRSWYDFLPFSHKKSPSQTSIADHLAKSKNSSPASTQNKPDGKSPNRDDKLSISKQELDTPTSSSMWKPSSSHLFSSQNQGPKHEEKQKNLTGPISKPVNHSDLQLSSSKEKILIKTEPESIASEEFTQQQHKKFQEQVKKYAKLKQKGKLPHKLSVENQVNEKTKENEHKTRNHKHKERNHVHAKKSSEINQCLNCQMKAQRFSLPDAAMGESSPSNNQAPLSKKNRNRHISRLGDDLSQHLTNTSHAHRENTAAMHNGHWVPTSEGMYVTFNKRTKPAGHHSFPGNSRNPQTSSNPHYPEQKEERRVDSMEMVLRAAKLMTNSKCNNLSQDANPKPVASSDSKLHFEKSSQNSSISTTHTKHNGEILPSSHFPKSTSKSVTPSYHNMTYGLNGLTFSGTPLCYGGDSINFKDSATIQSVPITSSEPILSSKDEPPVTESVKRRDGGEYNNLSLDVHVNSLHAECPVKKSYVKRVPWDGENINTAQSPSHDENVQKYDHGYSSPLSNNDSGEMENSLEDMAPIFRNATNGLNNLTSLSKDLELSSSSTINLQAHHKGHEINQGDKENRRNGVNHHNGGNQPRLSPVDGEQNWQEILTNSHDYFDWKYRLCFDASDVDSKNSSPPSVSEKTNMRVTNSLTLSSLEANTCNDHPAYVSFMSCPSVPMTTEEKNTERLHKNNPPFMGNSELPNGIVPYTTSSSSMMNSSLSGLANRHNESASLSTNSIEEIKKHPPRKNDGLSVSPGGNGFNSSFPSMHKNTFYNDNDVINKATLENKTSVCPSANHLIPSATVANGIRGNTSLSSTTRTLTEPSHHIYIPVSLANGGSTPLSPLTNGLDPSAASINGIKASLMSKEIDYSKSMTDGFSVNSEITSSNSILKDTITSSALRDYNSCNFSQNSMTNGNFKPVEENLTRPYSHLTRRSENIFAARPLQKFPVCNFNDHRAHNPGKKLVNSTEKCFPSNGVLESDESQVSSMGNRKKEDIKRPFLCQNVTTSSHHSLPNQSGLDNHVKNLSRSNHADFNSMIHEMQKQSRPLSLSPEIDDKTHFNGRDGQNQRPRSESNQSNRFFCILPFGEYTVDNSSQHTPKSLPQFGCEVKKQPQKFNSANAALSKDHKVTAVQRREGKKSVYPNETARYSSCSNQSASEIQILKLIDARDTFLQSSLQESSRSHHSHHHKSDFEKTEKNSNALQVKYVPKSNGGKKPTTITDRSTVPMTTACSNSPSSPCSVSNEFPISANPKTLCKPQINVTRDPWDSNHSELSSMPAYANGSVLNGSSIATGPDLLQVSVLQPEQLRKTDSSSSRQSQESQSRSPSAQVAANPQPKKQSFLARLAHSPLSFLHRDSKNATESK